MGRLSDNPQFLVFAVVAILIGVGQAQYFTNQVRDQTCEVSVVAADEGVLWTSDGGKVQKGSNITVRAVIVENRQFEWTDQNGSVLSTDTIQRFTVTKDTTFYAKTTDGFYVTVYADVGIEYEGQQGSCTGSTMLRATGEDNFDGWYTLNGTRITNETIITITSSETDKHNLVARSKDSGFTGEGTIQYTPSKEIKEGSATFIITDAYSKSFVKYWSGVDQISGTICPGKYNILMVAEDKGGKKIAEVAEQKVFGDVSYTFKWKFDNTDYEYKISTSYSEFDKYQNRNVERWPYYESEMRVFLNDENSVIKVLGQFLKEKSSGFTELNKARFLLDFVQQYRHYQLDSDFNDTDEYFKFPFETLYNRAGDCEDSTLLFCALAKQMGMDSAALFFYSEGHAAQGISISLTSEEKQELINEAGQRYYFWELNYNGKTYYYCETTNTGWDVSIATFQTSQDIVLPNQKSN